MKIIALDFDGTIVKHEYPKIGEPVPHALRVINRLMGLSYVKLILYTLRSCTALTDAVDYCLKGGITFWGINQNPDQRSWSQSPKAYANLYIDDAALGCPLIYPNDNSRPFVNWTHVELLLESMNILSDRNK